MDFSMANSRYFSIQIWKLNFEFCMKKFIMSQRFDDNKVKRDKNDKTLGFWNFHVFISRLLISIYLESTEIFSEVLQFECVKRTM